MITCLLYEGSTFIRAVKLLTVPPAGAVVWVNNPDGTDTIYKVEGCAFVENIPNVKVFVK